MFLHNERAFGAHRKWRRTRHCTKLRPGNLPQKSFKLLRQLRRIEISDSDHKYPVRREMLCIPLARVCRGHRRNALFSAFWIYRIGVPLEIRLIHDFLRGRPWVLVYTLERERYFILCLGKIVCGKRGRGKHIAPERQKFVAVLVQGRKAERRIFELHCRSDAR